MTLNAQRVLRFGARLEFLDEKMGQNFKLGIEIKLILEDQS